MSRYVFKLPDLGEGTVQAEIVGWRVKPGDVVAEDDVLVEVMTEKAAVEVPSPVSGRVVSTTGGPGDMVPVGAELIVLDTQGGAGEAAAAKPVAATAEQANNLRSAPTQAAAASRKAGVVAAAAPGNGAGLTHSTAARSGRVATSPAIRRRAHEAGIDLTQVSGSGPKGRIVRQDLDAYVARRSQLQPVQLKPADKPAAARPRSARGGTEEIKVIGLRRLIAQRMSDSKRNIPHFAYVEEIDVTELEALRRHLNGKLEPGAAALTYLPFLVLGLVRVLEAFPQCNALYDAERAVIVRHASVHVGVATQTAEGLKVPVVRDAQSRSLWDLAAEMRRVTEAARTNKATREELTGSTITITSLGKLGGIASTPIINAPEVAIIGVNRAYERPVVLDGAIAVRRMMNLSSSFDHRFVDGYDAAAMIQALKELLEHPAAIFIGA
ncbi:MAG: 2-oxo acid dehydrogenase subunit E2 [Gammaproteobacteria bacterium]|nr:MAG: 2-oxo acid dehydrogenase subunit E2 [Gammaproteobacteria bacterium]